ncbi:MAG: dipeptidyl aminopeptidase/acylaminoacyl peptidase [Crocinitomicaceae bacterium]|jgi:dipeptidyl aminopeptidase/acylaminoacyl peptidase
MKIFITLVLLTLTRIVSAQIENTSSLKLPEIMKGNEFIGHQPNNIRWAYVGKTILFEWNPENEPGDKTFAYSLTDKVTVSIQPSFYEENSEYNPSQFQPKLFDYFTYNGAIYQYDIKNKSTEVYLKMGQGARNLMNIKDNSSFYYQIGSDLYKSEREQNASLIVLQFKKGEKPAEVKKPTHWVTQEEELFEFHKDNKEKKDWNKIQDSIWNEETPTVYHGKHSVSNIQISPDERFVTYRLNKRADGDRTHVEHHISADGYTYAKDARPKVSDNDPSHKMGIYDLENDTSYLIDFSDLTDIRKKPAYLSEYGDTETQYEKDRSIIMHKMIFSEDGKRNIMDIRSYDNKDRWIVSIDLKKGTVRELEHQHDEAWIGGPGISSWNMVSGTLGWINNNEFYFQSEKTGYSHLYSRSVYLPTLTALTSGNWEVHDVQLSKDKTKFFITANKTHPGDRGFYHLIIKNKKLIPILTKPGNHEVSISPDEKTLAVRYSSKNKPWELYTAVNKENSTLTQITESTTDEFKAYDWFAPEVITFTASDGVPVNARLYKPEKENANGAAVVFVHGAGYLQNAHNFWSGYYREYMFHNMLRDNGYTIIDIDFRASKGYGRDFRTAIYRNMGGKDLSDQVDGRQYLIDSLGIDPDRIGMYGGSYGGFITLMALLNEPGKFQAGAAIRSVTDWNHYNHEYTSNILNYPTTDPDAYKNSSPITFADNLEDRLIMLHGMVDDNVQFQDVVRMSQRFIELGKENWELAVYPVEAHGFKKATSWTDEYRRIYELFNEELLLKKK